MEQETLVFESENARSRSAWRFHPKLTAMICLFLLAFTLLTSIAAVMAAPSRPSVKKVNINNWDDVKENFLSIFGTSNTVVNDMFVEYRSGDYTHLKISKEGFVSSHMPLHRLKAQQDNLEIEFNVRDKAVTVIGKEIDYTYRKP